MSIRLAAQRHCVPVNFNVRTMGLLIASYIFAPLVGALALLGLGPLGLFFGFIAVPVAYACAFFPGIPLIVIMLRRGLLSAFNFVLFGLACASPAAIYVLVGHTDLLGMWLAVISLVGGTMSGLVIWAIGVRGNEVLTRHSTPTASPPVN